MKKIILLLLTLLPLAASAQERRLYDFVVPRDGSLKQALRAADERTDTARRFRIFIMQGQYQLPTEGTTKGGDNKEYGDARSYLRSPNVSIIGEDRDRTVVCNTVPEPTWDNGFGQANPLEGIGRGDVLILEKKCRNTYLQDLTLRSSMGDKTGRNIVLHDRSTLTVAKNVCLWGYQDTYVSNNKRGQYYFEGGIIRGRTDYICGKGDVFYRQVTFQQCGLAGYIAVPSEPYRFGYVMDSCHIKSETPDVTYYLGRPWGKGTPTALWINTVVDTAPIAKDKRGVNGWADMSGGWPARYAEYNTRLTTGEQVDLSGRRALFVDREGVEHFNAPLLSASEAALYTLQRVFAPWQPQELTRPVAEPQQVSLKGRQLTWTDVPDALLYAIARNGRVEAFTTTPTYRLPRNAKKTDEWAVSAANQMGGLGAFVALSH